MFPPPRLDQLWCETGTRVDLFYTGCTWPRICWDSHWFTPKRQNSQISVETAGGVGGRGLPGYRLQRVQIRMESVSKLWKTLVPAKIRAYVKDYCKRNGLLTLSVIAVVTGCMLGFLLRTFNLSTQVRPNQQNSGILFQCRKSKWRNQNFEVLMNMWMWYLNMNGEHSQSVLVMHQHIR